MLALVVDHGPGGPVRFADVDEPVPAAGETLVEVHHIGINPEELEHVREWPAGAVHGHDASGVVLRAAADGTGPPEGTRVALGLAHHAWAERVAVGPARLGIVPDCVDLADAAALGIAGVTVLQVLRRRSLLARNVLITNAGNGVGHFAVQLAALAGARVTALVGAPHGTTALQAEEIPTGLAETRFDLVLDTGRGRHATRVGDTSAPVDALNPFPVETPVGSGYSAHGTRTPLSAELTDLLDLLAAGKITAPIGLRGTWEEVDDVVGALLAGKVRRKIVLDVV